jgi:hypothetical protein
MREREPNPECLFADPEYYIKSVLLNELESASGISLSWTAGSTPEGRHWWVLAGCAEGLWPTPSSHGSSGEISPDLVRKGAKLVNSKTGRVLQTNLATEVKWNVARWPTPRATDWKDGRRGIDPRHGRMLGEEARDGLKGMRLNPEWVAQLMGAPEGWLDA